MYTQNPTGKEKIKLLHISFNPQDQERHNTKKKREEGISCRTTCIGFLNDILENGFKNSKES